MDTLWGVIVRTGQTAIEASPTLLIGFAVAAVLRRMLGAAGTRRLFGGDGFAGLFRAWVIGSLLPVCSLGVIPVARELRRAGVPSHTVLAFVLAAPQLNPLSFLYGLTLSEPLVIVCYVVATMALAVAGGELWRRLFESRTDAGPPGDEPTPAPGIKRLLAVVVSAGRDAVGPSTAYVIAGVVFTGVMAGLIPHGSLALTMRHDDPLSPGLMALIGTMAYSGVLPGMMRIGLIFEHGNSSGAAFVLFELGVGMNFGLAAWLVARFGLRAAGWLGVVAALTLAVGYGMESPLYFAHEEASHTHAFDDWTSPFASGQSVAWPEARVKLAQKVEVLEPLALAGLAALLAIGVGVNLAGAPRLDRWLLASPPDSSRPVSVWERGVPGPVLGAVALVGLVAFSVAALYIYYPDSDQAFAEIAQVRAEALTAVRTGNTEEAIRRVQQWDLLTRKLQVGAFLRSGSLDADAGRATEELRERLEELRDAMIANDPETAKRLLKPVEEAARKCRDSYRGTHAKSAERPGSDW